MDKIVVYFNYTEHNETKLWDRLLKLVTFLRNIFIIVTNYIVITTPLNTRLTALCPGLPG